MRDWGNEYAVLADPGLQRHLIWRPAVPRRQRPLADFRRDADRQSRARLLLPVGRLCRAVGDLDDRVVAAGNSGGGVDDWAGRIGHGAHFPAAVGLRAAATGLADGRV